MNIYHLETKLSQQRKGETPVPRENNRARIDPSISFLLDHPKARLEDQLRRQALNVSHSTLRAIISDALLNGVRGIEDDWLECNLRWGCSLAQRAFYVDNLTKRAWMTKIGDITNLVCSRYNAVTDLTEMQYNLLAPHIMGLLFTVYSDCCALGYDSHSRKPH